MSVNSRGIDRVERFQNVGSARKLICCAKFPLGQFYVAKTRSNGGIVSGQILGNHN